MSQLSDTMLAMFSLTKTYDTAEALFICSVGWCLAERLIQASPCLAQAPILLCDPTARVRRSTL